jgi:uncharacterized LabA/DUF88 family protein
MPVENVAILVDIQNLYHSSINFGGSKISYKKLTEKIGENRNVVLRKAYAAHRDGKAAKNFYSALEKIGYEMISRRVSVKKLNNDAVKIIPVHFEVEITADACFVPQNVDTVVLCTGNGNFEYLIDKLKNEGINVEVWSFKESTSEKLMKSAKFVQIPQECLLSSNVEEVSEVK